MNVQSRTIEENYFQFAYFARRGTIEAKPTMIMGLKALKTSTTKPILLKRLNGILAELGAP